MARTIEKKQVCKCENCGNEAEMVITCALPETGEADKAAKPALVSDHKAGESADKVKGTGVCSHCGNEADMWIDM